MLRQASDVRSDCHRLGRYRTTPDGQGEYAIVHRDAGDAAPFLPSEIYEALHFLPAFDALPAIEDWEQFGLLAEPCPEGPIIA
jgi:hypothetical protein